MSLYKISDRYPNYRDIYFDGGDLKGMDLYSFEKSRVGIVKDLLVDHTDRLKYLVAQLNDKRQVLIPVISCTRTTDENSLYMHDLSSEDIYSLETYGEVDDAADKVNVGVSSGSALSTVGLSMSPVEHSVPVEMTVPVDVNKPTAQHSHSGEQVTRTERTLIPLYEERLSTKKRRVKTGEVKISKQVVTETHETATPVRKEKIVIEIESIYGGETQIAIDEAEVAEDGSMTMAIYEERAEVCRQVRPYQNIFVRKETVQDVVKTKETLRREELSVNPDGLPYVDWRDDQ